MDKAEDYLKRAEEAERQAARAPDVTAKREFLASAALWRELAHSAGSPRGR
jgi:hypothetical protein